LGKSTFEIKKKRIIDVEDEVFGIKKILKQTKICTQKNNEIKE
jgi:hypothetical protein